MSGARYVKKLQFRLLISDLSYYIMIQNYDLATK